MFSGVYTGISLFVRPSVCLSVYKILVSVKALAGVLTLSQTSPGFYVSAAKVLRKHCRKNRD